MSAVRAYDPIHVLKPVADDIWIVDGPIIHMQQFGLSVPFPTRMTVIRLGDGSLFVHSPVAPCDSLFNALQELGPVAHLVSPNKIHYASIGVWSERYPDAITWASPGVATRARQREVPVTFRRDLVDTPDPAWSQSVDQLIFRGGRFMEEVVFFHRPSRTLILADLIENFEASKVSPGLAWLLKLAGNLDPDGKLPIDLRMSYWGRRDVARRCYQRMLSWEPERVIVAHGRWYDKDGTRELKRAFRWLGTGD